MFIFLEFQMNKILVLLLFVPTFIFSTEKNKEYGEFIGHILWERCLDDKDLDVKDIVNGMKEASENIPAKLKADEVMKLCLEMEKQQFETLAKNNLEASIAFLKEIHSQNDIQIIVKDKIYIKIVEEGEEDGLLAHESGKFKMKASRQNGETFYLNEEGVMQSLEVAIEGFSKGAIGMKLQEKRIIYIHPDYAYGLYHPFHPNTTIIVEVERAS